MRRIGCCCCGGIGSCRIGGGGGCPAGWSVGRWGWELPGGLVDEDEEPAKAAGRELEEETGYRAGRVEQLIAFQPRAGAVDGELFAFVGRDPERIGEPTEVNEVARVE